MTSPMLSRDRGEDVGVLYVLKRNAKKVKNDLEKEGMLNKDFRMMEGVGDEWKECIAVPIIEDSSKRYSSDDVMGYGRKFCPYSTSLLGNHQQRTPRTGENSITSGLTMVQRALLSTADSFGPRLPEDDSLTKVVQSLSLALCPKKLEMLGDDNTLVIPRKAFDGKDDTFREFVLQAGCSENRVDEFLQELWKQLAAYYKIPRVVRKGEIDPESAVRVSGYRLLWPYTGIPETTGPDSPGWITITEQGIKQSFDLTRVMFCRGNISEKIRFGKLVQRGEIVLDLYAGIGYFTVPALVHGQCEYLYACEWNPNAVEALLYNLQDNQVSERATVYTGDCRVVAKENNLVNMFDRVSLGLIPSSEGGWRTAVRAIRNATGGWLHVHANVPVKEVGTWSLWLCCCLRDLIREEDKPDNWVVLCTHVEKVKSFAPTVNHYVTDVFIGPADRLPFDVEMKAGHAALLHDNQRIEHCPASMPPSSCALSPEGVLHQGWMRE